MGGAASAGVVLSSATGAARQTALEPERRGRITQSVARWCFEQIPLPEFCRQVAALRLPAIDLLEMEEWPVAIDHGLRVSCGMVGAGTIEDGLNDPANHETIIRAFEENIPKAAEAGVPNVICFFGNRRGMEDARGIANSISCLRRCTSVAEDQGVTILVELLNSKVSHPDYIGDRTPYGVGVIRAVDSPRVKLLYDIYHMQVMEGDIIRTLSGNHEHIAHYHTGGVPGRAEIDETQELNYPAVVRAILETGFEGYMAHEFIPRSPDPIQSLREAVTLCDV
jgi:hydroxypyruvate isomerase